MQRRSFLGLLCGSVASALLAGCGGGGSSAPRKTIHGIVLEDDGSGNVKAAGAGKRIAAVYSITDSSIVDTIVTTDAQGRFTVDLLQGRGYGLKTDSYPGSLNFIPIPIGAPSCATGVGVDGITATSERVYYGSGGESLLPNEWSIRAEQYVAQYKANGEDIDVVILADLPCVAH